MARESRRSAAVVLLREGVPAREVATRLGLSEKTVRGYRSDPDGAKDRARKASYSQPCPYCGHPMSGADGLNSPPSQCIRCVAANNTLWTRERIIRAFQEFHRFSGRAPRTTDTILGNTPTQRRNRSAERDAEYQRTAHIKLPGAERVRNEFGGWHPAVRAAGLEPGPPGGAARRSHQPSPTGRRIMAVLSDGPKTAGEVAAALGTRPNMRPFVEGGLIVYSRSGRNWIYRLNSERKDTTMARDFIVLKKNGERGWVEVSTVPAATITQAIEEAAKEEGVYVAVPAVQFEPVSVGNVTRLGVLR